MNEYDFKEHAIKKKKEKLLKATFVPYDMTIILNLNKLSCRF